MACKDNRVFEILMLNRGVFPIPRCGSGGGAEHHAYLLAGELGKNHKVYFITRLSHRVSMGNNVSVIPLILNQTYIPTNAGFIGWILKHLFAGLFVAYRAFKMLAKQSFDVIHAHGNLSALIISFFKRGSPLIYTVHDSTPWVRYYTSKFEEIIRKLAFICIELPAWKRADHIIAVNKGIQREAVRFRVSKDKCSVIPSGVATQQSKPMSS